jgi:hypothetical protein
MLPYTMMNVSPLAGAVVKVDTVKTPPDVLPVIDATCPRKLAVVVSDAKMMARFLNWSVTAAAGLRLLVTTLVVDDPAPTVPSTIEANDRLACWLNGSKAFATPNWNSRTCTTGDALVCETCAK